MTIHPFQGVPPSVLGVKLKRGLYVFWLFFKIDLCSATSMESSPRDLSNDVAERGSILNNNQNTHYSLIFLGRPMLSYINRKFSSRPFE